MKLIVIDVHCTPICINNNISIYLMASLWLIWLQNNFMFMVYKNDLLYCIDISCTAQEKCAKNLCEIHIIFCFTQATVMYIKISNYIRGILENSHEWEKLAGVKIQVSMISKYLRFFSACSKFQIQRSSHLEICSFCREDAIADFLHWLLENGILTSMKCAFKPDSNILVHI